MSKKPQNVGLKLKNMNISLDSTVIRRPLPKNKRLWPGLKKGSGQLPGGGPVGAIGGEAAAEGLELAAELLHLIEEAPPLENITDQQPITGEPADSAGQQNSTVPPTTGDAPTDPTSEQTTRYVKGAHLISKKAVEEGQFEELWIYSIDPNTTEPANTPLKAILAGTDIPENGTQSEDGTQSYSLWTAGNAQFVHIKGLPN